MLRNRFSRAFAPFCALLLGCSTLLSACGGGQDKPDTQVLLQIERGNVAGAVDQIDLVVTAGPSTYVLPLRKLTGATEIPLPYISEVSVPSSDISAITVEAIAYDAAHVELGRGKTAGQILAGEVITLTLVFGEDHSIVDGGVPIDGALVPSLSLDPLTHAFGDVARGQSASRTLTITNFGSGASGPLSVSIVGAQSSQFQLANNSCEGQAIAGSGTCTVDVVFRPLVAGAAQATVAFSATPGGRLETAVSGTGVEPAMIAIDPALQDFASVVIGQSSAPARVTVRNTGGVATSALTVSKSGMHASEFDLAMDLCTGQTLAPNATCTFSVAFHPIAAGAKTASAAVTATPGGATTLALSGTGITPGELTLTPTSATYTSTLVGALGDTMTYQVRNTGGATAGALTVALQPTTDFMVTSDACTGRMLVGSGSCAISVRFQPQSAGSKVASLTVVGTPGGTAAASLSGSGLSPALLTGSPSAFTFGTVDVGSQSTAQSFKVTNTGDVATGALSTTLTGSTTHFLLTNGCTGTLAAKTSCNISIVYAPTAGGSHSLTVALGATPGGTISATATGTGRPPRVLRITKSGTGTGTVATSSGSAINCGATCQTSYVHGTAVTLTATTSTGSTFTAWTGCAQVSGNTCTVTMDQDRTINAQFTLSTFNLTVTPATGGSVDTIAPSSGITCGSDCEEDYAFGTPVTLRATAQNGYTFAGWGGACQGQGTGLCSITITQDSVVVPSFTLNSYDLVVTAPSNGTITSTTPPGGINCGLDCTERYNHGTSVTLHAAPNTGYRFGSWGGSCASSTTADCTLSLTAARTASATFVRQATLTVTTMTGGTITTMTPSTGINCGSDCSEGYDIGTAVTIQATPQTGYIWAGWTGDCGNQDLPICTLTMSQDRTVGVFFIQTFTLTATPDAHGTISTLFNPGIDCGADCTETVQSGQFVILHAQPITGFAHTGWTGACAGVPGATDCELTISANTTVGATYAAGHTLRIVDIMNGRVTSTNVPGIDCTPNCAATYATGQTITLHAEPDAGFGLFGWTGACVNAGTADCMVVMGSADISIFPIFFPTHLLTVVESGASGGGTVTADVAAASGPSLNCGAICQAQYFHGQTVVLTATPKPGFGARWMNTECANTGNVCTLSISAPTTAQVIYFLP